MSMLEKFNGHKKTMEEKMSELEKEFEKKVNEVGEDFIDGFKSLVSEASEEEFAEFLKSKEIDEVDRIAAITMRMESRLEKLGKKSCENQEGKKGSGIAVFVL